VATTLAVRASVPLANRLLMRVLESRFRRVFGDRLAVLRYTAASGAAVSLPVMAARTEAGAVVLVGRPNRKRWWRHFRSPATLDALFGGRWYFCTGQVVMGGPSSAAAGTYRRAFPRAPIGPRTTFVLVTIAGQAG
jgi:hypothetical protein